MQHSDLRALDDFVTPEISITARLDNPGEASDTPRPLGEALRLVAY
jgi:hypothetical protein